MTDITIDEREESVAHDFFIMHFKEMAAGIPQQAREALAAALGAHFDVKAKNLQEDKGLERFFLGVRLRLESMPDIEASKKVFARAVIAAQDLAQEVEVAPESGVVQATTVADAEPPPTEPGRPFLYVAPTKGGAKPIEEDFPGLLLPHPGDIDRGRYMGYWLSGRCWNAGTIAISFPLDTGAGDVMAEAEAEYAAAPDIFMARFGIKPLRPARPGKDREDWLLREGNRGADEDADAVRKAFARAVGRAWNDIDPAVSDQLHAHGACLEMGDDALRLVASAMSIERSFHPDIENEPDPERRCLAHGAISPNYPHYAGISLTHAAGRHIVTGAPLSEALSEALAELRLAQVLRRVEEPDQAEVIETFDAKFFSDCRAPLSSYSIAKNEPELA